MGSVNMLFVYKKFLLPAMAVSILAIPILTLLLGFSAVSVAFYAGTLVFMALHWWLIASFVESLFNGERTIASIRCMLAVFPAALALALVFIAGKTDRTLMLFAGSGIIALPASTTVFCIVQGIIGLTPFRERKE